MPKTKQRTIQIDDALRMMRKMQSGGSGGGGIAQETDPTVPAWAKQPNKPTYTAAEVGALPNTTTIPSKTSQLTNDSGFLTQHQSLSGYAKTADHYTKTESDNKYQPKGSYLTSVPSEYVTETELAAKKYLTAVPSEYITESELTAEIANHESNTSIHVTSAEKQTWNNKANRTDIPTIAQEVGESESLVMSQKAVTNAISEAIGSGGGGIEGILPIEQGGTGASTAAQALENLGGYPKAGGDINGHVYLQNAKYIYGRGEDSTELNLIGVNDSNNILVGYGSYNNELGETRLYGDTVHIYSNNYIRPHHAFLMSNNYGLRTYLADGTTNVTMIYTSTSNNLVLGSTTGINNMYLYTKNFTLRLCPPDSGSTNDGYFYPVADNTVSLGTTAHKWTRVYAGNSSISTSDKRQKENIKHLKKATKKKKKDDGTIEEIRDVYSELFDRLEPVEYNFIDGEQRKDFGLIAQDVLEVMTELGLAEDELDLVHHDTWIDEETGEEKDAYGIAYENLIPMLIHEVQKLKERVK